MRTIPSKASRLELTNHKKREHHLDSLARNNQLYHLEIKMKVSSFVAVLAVVFLGVVSATNEEGVRALETDNLESSVSNRDDEILHRDRELQRRRRGGRRRRGKGKGGKGKGGSKGRRMRMSKGKGKGKGGRSRSGRFTDFPTFTPFFTRFPTFVPDATSAPTPNDGTLAPTPTSGTAAPTTPIRRK